MSNVHLTAHLLLNLVKSQWISPSTATLPRLNDGMAAGSYNDSIYLLGGYTAWTSTLLVEYDISRDLFIDNQEMFPIGIFGYSSYYTQIDHHLYFINNDGDALSSYDLTTNSLDALRPQFTTIPTNVNEYGCLASNRDYLFVIGGYFDATLDKVQVLDLTNEEWLTSVPPMQEARSGHSCVVNPSTNVLYVIGGFTLTSQGKLTEDIHTKSIEKIDTTDIAQNHWSYISSLLLTSASYSRSVLHHNTIYIIGGADGETGTYTFYDTVHVINLLTEQVYIASHHLLYPVIYPAATVIDDKIYVFGGYNGVHLDSWMMYPLPQISSTQYPIISTTHTVTTNMDLKTIRPNTTNSTIMKVTTQHPTTTTTDIDLKTSRLITTDTTTGTTMAVTTQYRTTATTHTHTSDIDLKPTTKAVTAEIATSSKTDMIQIGGTLIAVFETSNELNGDEINKEYDGKVKEQEITVNTNTDDDNDATENESTKSDALWLILCICIFSVCVVVLIGGVWMERRKRRFEKEVEHITTATDKVQSDTNAGSTNDADTEQAVVETGKDQVSNQYETKTMEVVTLQQDVVETTAAIKGEESEDSSSDESMYNMEAIQQEPSTVHDGETAGKETKGSTEGAGTGDIVVHQENIQYN